MHKAIIHNTLRRLGTILMVTMFLAVAACNKSEDDPYAEPSASVAVNSFKLRSNPKVLANLDSVFFSVDLEHGVIFNADSLPKGTDISKLQVTLSYASTVKGATITMSGGSVRTGEIDYMASPNDSIDFTGDVALTLLAQDGVTSRSYRLKVNVHRMDPDRMSWDRMASSTLPSRMPAPVEQKSIAFGEKAYVLIQEADGSHTLASSSDPDASRWEKRALDLPFEPKVRSFAASDRSFYILDASGALYSSADGIAWSAAGQVWETILGGYGDYVLGIRMDDGRLTHTSYPAASVMPETPVEAGFPVAEQTNLGCFSSRWAELPTAILCGGVCADGSYSRATWAFDGSRWSVISTDDNPALAGATLTPYFSYRKTSTSWIQTEYSVWMMTGGHDADGNFANRVYISYNNGVTWEEGGELLRFPETVPLMSRCDNVVLPRKMTGSLVNWTESARRDLAPWYRIDYAVSGYDVKWDCPVIYMFGGHDASGALQNTIWRGVLNRLTFVPLF